jgi:hypothetical protein
MVGQTKFKAIEEAMGDRDRVSFKEAMSQLYKFCWNHGWSHGVPFDIVVMEHAWRQLGQLGLPL